MSQLSEQDGLTLLLEAYRANQCLWDTANPLYMNREVKQSAYESLLEIYKRSQPDATMEILKKKLDNLRGSYRREKKKVEESKGGTGKPKSAMYVSKLWFYDLLAFLDDKDSVREGSECGILNSEDSDKEHQNNEENDGVKNGDNSVLQNTQPTASRSSISQPARPLQRMVKKRKLNGPIARQNKLLRKACSYLENSANVSKEPTIPTIAKAWGEKLLQLQPQQRLLAEKAINDVLFEASMGTLNRYSVKINK